jgi:hypothetical protein
LGLRPMQPSPIAESSRAPVRSCLFMFVLFPAAEGVRWLVSLPEDETVLTVVRGVVVSVEHIRPGRRRFWRHEVEDLSAPIIQQEIFGPVPTSEIFDEEKDPGGDISAAVDTRAAKVTA